jgi:hypothetical protein
MFKKLLLALTLAGLTYAVTPAAMAQDAPSSDQQSAPAGAPPSANMAGATLIPSAAPRC